MTKHNGRKSSHHIYQNLEDIKNDLSRLSESIKNETSNFVSDSIAQTKSKSVEMKNNFSERVSQEPMKSVGIALLTGAIIGYFVHR